MLRKLVLAVAVAAVGAAPAAAQDAGSFRVGPRIGYISYANETGIQASALLGLDAVYHVTDGLAFGFNLDVSRPQTDSSFFPAEMSFGDTTFIFGVKQPLTVVNFEFAGELSLPGRFSPFILGGIGGYRVNTDPQVARGATDFTQLGFSFGGGIAFQAGGGTNVRIEVRDYVFTNFDRSQLNPVDARFTPTRFPDVLPAPEPFDGSAHNIAVTLAFSFTPGGSR